MASACINPSPETSYSWFNPRLSDLPEATTDPVPEDSDLNDGFEFHLINSSTMLPADELFSDGKLIVPCIKMKDTATSSNVIASPPDGRRCSRRRWKELLGFGKPNNVSKLETNSNKRMQLASSTNADNGTSSTSKSIRQFLHRSSKSTSSTDSLPLLKDLDTESVSVSSRPSLSSSSSGHEHDDLPRLSLDSDKPTKISLNTRPKTRMVVKTRVAATRAERGLSIDSSPRMNSCGKIVFQSLERSSSSPSSLNGGPRLKHRGMERSYSANVRITPLLNVPVCSLGKSGGMFGFPIFSSSQQKPSNGVSNRSQRFNAKSH